MRSPRVPLAASFVVLVAFLGCKHGVESPAVSADPAKPTGQKGPVDPDLVCVEQLTTGLVLSGEGFTPFPSQTLQKTIQLLLPTVQVTRATAIDGTAASGGALVADDSRDPASSHVRWSSERQMGFDVYPDLALQPGLYDVTVTNRDGRHSATFAGGFAGVARPVISGVGPDLVCVAQADQVIALTGSGFLDIGGKLPGVHAGGHELSISAVDDCIPVPGAHAAGAIRTCRRSTFTVPKGSFDPGQVELTLTNAPTAACSSTEQVRLTIVPAPTVASIASDLICDGQEDQAMIVRGAKFLEIGGHLPSVLIGNQNFPATSLEDCTPVSGSYVEGAVATCGTLRFAMPTGSLSEGDYPVVVVNPAPAGCGSSEAVYLHVAPPPSVTGFAQANVCDAQSAQSVTIQGAHFLQIGAALPTVTIDGADYVPTASGCTAAAGALDEGGARTCNALTITIPQGALATGSYPITVKNPAPAGCSTTSAVALAVLPPPSVASVSPASICAGGGTLTVDGLGFGAAPTLTLRADGHLDVPASQVTVSGAGTHISAEIPAGAAARVQYDVVVSNGCEDRPLPHKTLYVTSGPKIFFADPEVVYNGINTRVTLYVTGLSLPLTSVSMSPAGQAEPTTQLQYNLAANSRVQVIIPSGTAPGRYDLRLADSANCPARLSAAISVADALTLTLESVVPPFGWKDSSTDITIFRDQAATAPGNAPFMAVPRVFLNPSDPQPSDVAIQLTATSMLDANTLTAVVPKGSPVHAYDLVVVNPNGAVGLLPGAFTVTQEAPPVIANVTPASVVNATGQTLVVSGTDFRDSTLSIDRCADLSGNPVTAALPLSSGPASCSGRTCTQSGTMDASALAVGVTCIVKLTNGDGTWAIYSAIGVTGPSLNLPKPTRAGTPMTTARRAPVAAAGDATQAARFVYAIGGDDGLSTVHDTAESAPVDIFGNVGVWSPQRNTLGSARSFAAGAQLGRYIYLCGGTDGTAFLSSCVRGMILDPLESPGLDVAELQVQSTGLDPGYWFYRVAATFADNDPDNPGGESLPSDEIVVKTPALVESKVKIVLSWSPPVDSQSVELPNINGYRIYRTPDANGAANGEVLIATVNADTLTYSDDGSAIPGTATPLPLGSIGQWRTLPAMASARKGLAMTWAADPVTAGQYYVYSFFGQKNSTTANGTFEYLRVNVQPNGHQTFASSWNTGTAVTSQPRWQLGAFRGDSTVSTFVRAPDTFIWLGGGELGGGGAANQVDAGKVAAGGDIASFSQPKGFTSSNSGYGAFAANGQLFVFGGAGPSNAARSATLIDPAPSLASNSWNNEGLSMRDARYLPGSAVQSAYLFLIGGQTASLPATKSTEVVIW